VAVNGRTEDLTQAATPEVYLSLWQANAFSVVLWAVSDSCVTDVVMFSPAR
jgi:hypothetical protein